MEKYHTHTLLDLGTSHNISAYYFAVTNTCCLAHTSCKCIMKFRAWFATFTVPPLLPTAVCIRYLNLSAPHY